MARRPGWGVSESEPLTTWCQRIWAWPPLHICILLREAVRVLPKFKLAVSTSRLLIETGNILEEFAAMGTIPCPLWEKSTLGILCLLLLGSCFLAISSCLGGGGFHVSLLESGNFFLQHSQLWCQPRGNPKTHMTFITHNNE